MIHPEIRDLARGRTAWGTSVVLQACPVLESGWRPGELQVHLDPSVYRLPPEDRARFEEWERALDVHSTLRRGTSLRLMDVPASFTDDPDLHVRVQETRYIDVQFFRLVKAVDPDFRIREIRSVLAGDLEFPNSFSLHAVVTTSDGWVLATLRSPQVTYFPQTWSVSIEEQLRRDDVGSEDDTSLRLWASRMLREELGIPATHAQDCDVRAFAVFLEADILNCALLAMVSTPLSRRQLDAVLTSHPRADYEFQEWTFLRWSDLAGELARPSRTYHPTAGLRMLLAGASRYGFHAFGAKLDKSFLQGPPKARPGASSR